MIPSKDPSAILDYVIDWSQWLEDDETLTNAMIDVGAGLELNPGEKETITTPESVTFWLGGGQLNRTYFVQCHIQTSDGREDKRSFRLRIASR